MSRVRIEDTVNRPLLGNKWGSGWDFSILWLVYLCHMYVERESPSGERKEWLEIGLKWVIEYSGDWIFYSNWLCHSNKSHYTQSLGMNPLLLFHSLVLLHFLSLKRDVAPASSSSWRIWPDIKIILGNKTRKKSNPRKSKSFPILKHLGVFPFSGNFA